MTTDTPTLSPPRADEHDRRHLGLTVGLAILGIFVTYVPITGVSITLTSIGQAAMPVVGRHRRDTDSAEIRVVGHQRST